MLSPRPYTRFGSVIISIIVVGISVSLLSGCGKKNREEAPVDFKQSAPAPSSPATGPGSGTGNGIVNMTDASADTTMGAAATTMSSSAARINPQDSIHKFIRTADLKFKTKDVVKTTYQIEDIVAGVGGYVANTALKSEVEEKTSTPISEDSMIEVTNYTVSNAMTIRVPDTKLDSTLKALAPLVEYLDYRTVSAHDVSLDILENTMAARREAMHGKRLTTAIDSKGKKLGDIVDAEENVNSAAAGADNAALQNLRYADQIRYSTIQLSLYQRQSVMKQMLVNPKGVEQYRPNIGLQLVEALQVGWRMLESIIVSIVKLWGIILCIVLLYIGYRYMQKRTANAE